MSSLTFARTLRGYSVSRCPADLVPSSVVCLRRLQPVRIPSNTASTIHCSSNKSQQIQLRHKNPFR